MSNNGEQEKAKKPSFFERIFHFKEKGGTWQRDILGGLVTFAAMCYIIPVNASILTDMGMDSMGVFASTCLVSALVTILMAFIANVPVALSAGMGLNAYLAYTICGNLGYTWHEGMLLLLVTGVIFFVISLTPIRRKVIEAFPKGLRKIVSAGLGCFIAFVGLKGSGIISESSSTLVTLGSLWKPSIILALLGILVCFALMFIKTKRGLLNSFAVPITMLGVALIGYCLSFAFTGELGDGLPTADWTTNWGINGYQNVIFFGYCGSDNGESFSDLCTNVFTNPASYVVIFSLIFVNMFDTTATLMTVGEPAKIMDSNGNFINNRAIIADATGALICAPLGTATVTSFAESVTGVNVGARTGFASLITGLCFLGAAFAYPLFEIFTAPCVYGVALVAVGSSIFMTNLADIDWKDPAIGIAAFVSVIFIILTYSLTNGIGLGLLAFIIVMLVTKRGKEVSPILYVIGALYLASFAITAAMDYMISHQVEEDPLIT